MSALPEAMHCGMVTWFNQPLCPCMQGTLYAQSVPCIRGHNGLDATPLADSKIKG